MSIIKLKRTVWLTLCVFILFALFFYLAGYKETIPLYMEYMRGIFTIVYCYTLYIAINQRVSQPLFFCYLFVSFYLLSIILQYTVFYETNTLFGDARDSYSYIAYGIKYRNLGLTDYWEKILINYNFDDLGFFTILHFCALLLGRDPVSIANFLVLINSLIYIIGIHFLYRLTMILYDDEQRARLATGLWAGFSTLVTSNAGGEKEVVFTAIIVIAMYSIYAYKKAPSGLKLLRALFFISLCLFFRFAICYALSLSLLVIVFTNENNKKAVLKLAFLGILFSSFILSFLLPLLTGISYEHILTVTDRRMAKTQVGTLAATFFSSISTILGPFPNMDRTNSKGFMYGFALLLKDFLSPYFISAFYSIIRNYSYRFYPILTFIVCNLMLVLVGGVALDIRYHVTYIPFFFLLVLVPHDFIFKGYKYCIILLVIVFVISVYSHRKFSKERASYNTEYMYLK